MSDKNKENDDACNQLKWVGGIAITCLLLLLGACIVMFWRTCKVDYHRPVSYRLAVVALPVAADSVVSVPQMNSKTDSMILQMQLEIAELKRYVGDIESINENLINDVRQETNNDINKLNGWLGFWIATSALLCIVVPMVFQHMSVRGERKRFVKEIDDKKTGFDEKIIKTTERLKSIEDTIENRFKIWRSLITIEGGIESKLMDPSKRLGDSLGDHLWTELCRSLEDMIGKELKNKTLSNDSRFQLMQYLLDMRSYIILIRRSIVKGRSRKINVLEDTITRVFNELDSGEYKWESLRESFGAIITSFRSLRSDVR